MLALSFWQPWATLVIIGAKRIETRSWPTDHRGAIFVHAAGKSTRAQIELWHEEPFHSVLRDAGIRRWQELPLGAVLGTVELFDCLKIASDEEIRAQPNPIAGRAAGLMAPPMEPELSFGLYEPGRYGWGLAKPNPFTTPVPHPGRQRLFNIHPQALGLR